MNQWPNGHANGMFPQASQGHLNPASMYSHLNNANNQFDPNQFSQGLGLPNGNSASPAPGFPNQSFQPGSVIPAKRPHDGMSGSPVPQQNSRSQTPSFNNFQNQQSGPQQFPNAPTAYQHLQQPGSNNATPSPTMQDQQYRAQSQQPQRMGNASPSPFPQQHQQSQQPQPQQLQQQNIYGNTMGAQMMNQNMQQQNQMGAFNQQFAMNPGMNMQGMQNMMGGQMNAMSMAQNNQQKAYQLKLLQHQQQLRNSGMIPPRTASSQQAQMFNPAAQQMAGQMPNGQAGGQANIGGVQQQQLKKAQFLKTIAQHAAREGRPFNPAPTISGRPVDLYVLWQIVTSAQGSERVSNAGQWPAVANRLGFSPQQYPNGPEELRQLYQSNILQYERLWQAMRAQQKQETARMHAHQMAGVGPTQASPTKMMQPPNQQNQYTQFQQGVQNQQQPQVTPVQAHAQLPQNGMTTPQQQTRRSSSSVRKPEQMTPQQAGAGIMAPSPHSVSKSVHRSPSMHQETSAPVIKREEPQSTNYEPCMRSIELDGGYNLSVLGQWGDMIAKDMPNMPTVGEMGVIDLKAITLSLASGIHGEVRYALDALVIISNDARINFDLEKCEDLLDYLIDCAEDQVDTLAEEAVEVSDALDLASYEDIVRGARSEADALQDVPPFGSNAFNLDRAADKLIAISCVLRNWSFFEHNHPQLTSPPLVKWLSNTIRLLGTRNMLLRTFYNAQDFYKDMIIFLSNITQALEIPSRDDALHILHFLLAFAPQPAPGYVDSKGRIRFPSFQPAIHRYLPPAVDCLAKILARAEPNRAFYRSIFAATTSSLAASESPLDLLTRAFALSISVLPDRSKGHLGNSTQLRIVDARKAYLTQGMLAADILSSLAPSNNTDLARAWIESEDGWVVGLLHLAAVLSVERPPPPFQTPKTRDNLNETHPFELITHRALSMMKRLAEKAGKGSSTHMLTVNGRGPKDSVNNSTGKSAADEDEDANNAGAQTPTPKWEGIPQGHAILGALMISTTDSVALNMLCGLHEMAMQT